MLSGVAARSAVLLVCAALQAACSTAGPTESPGPVPTPTAPASTSAAPVDTFFPEAELCPGGAGELCSLDAGEHHSLAFGDGLAFTVTGSHWNVEVNETDAIVLTRGVAEDRDVLAFITGAIRIDGEPVVDPARAFQLIGAIQSDGRDAVSAVLQPDEVVAGKTAVAFDAGTSDAVALFTFPVTGRAWISPSGRIARFLWATHDGAPFLVLIESDRTRFTEVHAELQPILDSLEFGDED